jgi:hypothetical protein
MSSAERRASKPATRAASSWGTPASVRPVAIYKKGYKIGVAASSQ